jgi:hypothetical protein
MWLIPTERKFPDLEIRFPSSEIKRLVNTQSFTPIQARQALK